jgi:hypothetical protein
MADIADNFDQQMLDLVNEERSKAGANPLKLNDKLDRSADAHTLDQAANNKMSHSGSNGSKLGDRIKNDGYIFSFAAENVAVGQKDPTQVMESWMNSSGHRTNILNPNLTEMGVGAATGQDGRIFWTQDFGTPIDGAKIASKPMNNSGSTQPKNMKMPADPLGSTTVGNPKDLQPSKNLGTTPANGNPMGVKMTFAPNPMISGDAKKFQTANDSIGAPQNPLGTSDIISAPKCPMNMS